MKLWLHQALDPQVALEARAGGGVKQFLRQPQSKSWHLGEIGGSPILAVLIRAEMPK
jgi:hypothetical protein